MKPIELRQKSADELAVLLKERELRLEELVLLLQQRKLKNVHELRGARRDIARIHTVLTSRK